MKFTTRPTEARFIEVKFIAPFGGSGGYWLMEMGDGKQSIQARVPIRRFGPIATAFEDVAKNWKWKGARIGIGEKTWYAPKFGE